MVNLVSCMAASMGQSEAHRIDCTITPSFPGAWLLALVCVILGILAVSATIVLIILSVWRRSNAMYAKWMGFIGVIFFCLAAVIFPIGFSQDEIGGAAYQLPNSYQVRRELYL